MSSNNDALQSKRQARNLKWHQLLALHDLYKDGRTAAALSGSYFKYLRTKSLIGPKIGSRTITEARPSFRAFYERNLKTDFERYAAFLDEAKLKDDGKRRYREEELVTLMLIHRERDQLRANLTSGATLATRMFGSSKYLLDRPGLETAVLQLLGVDSFPDRDPRNNQWRCVVDCVSPKAIVICENLTYLKLPWLAQEHQVELWYFGGNNTAMIEAIPKDYLGRPVYYSCDWDHHGLQIYCSIRQKLLAKSCELTLLMPHDPQLRLPVKSPHHNSEWKSDTMLSGLQEEEFTDVQKNLIFDLIKQREWIEEQSQDFVTLLVSNGVVTA